MSFQPPSAKQEQQSKKVLEELHLKKKLMLKQQASGVISPLPANAPACVSSPVPVPVASGSTAVPAQPTTSATDYHRLNKSQRAALQHAHANSFASFIPQDSSFGNLILPVMPRLEK